MRIAVGMDLHKSTAVCFASFAGEGEPKEKHVEFIDGFNKKYRTQPSTPERIADIANALKGHEAYILIENSTKTFEVYWILTNLGCNVIVAQAQDLFRITKSVKKTDMNDSMELSGYMRRYLHGEREFAVCTMPPKEWMMRRELCRNLFKEKLHLADIKRRARMHLLLHGISLSREYSDIFSQKACKELIETRDPVLMMLTHEAKDLKKRAEYIGKMIELYFKDDRNTELIQTVPGFGLVTSAYMSSMIIDINRFPSGDALAAYFGVVPKIRESAEHSSSCGTTHRGDEEARRLIMQAAFVHCVTVEDSVVKRMWGRLKSRGMAHREIQCACARKLLTVVWSVLKNNEPFTSDPEIKRISDMMSEELLEDTE